VFNSKSTGTIEVVQIPQNRQELLFKLKSGDRPFALMKIGDITQWLKEKLEGYEIIERFEDESIFARLNEDEDINILMGSRAFYEGWDSNRPNVIAFINIGIGKAAKKFALQSIGRGVRIEPFKNMKRRLEGYEELKGWTVPIETLFVFGTKSISLGIVLQTLNEIRARENSHRRLFERKSQKTTQRHEEIELRLHPEDEELVKKFLTIDDKVLVCMFDVNPKLLRKLKEEFDLIVKADPTERKVGIPEAVVKMVFRHFAGKWNIPLCPC
jgi:hypothetical protein